MRNASKGLALTHCSINPADGPWPTSSRRKTTPKTWTCAQSNFLCGIWPATPSHCSNPPWCPPCGPEASRPRSADAPHTVPCRFDFWTWSLVVPPAFSTALPSELRTALVPEDGMISNDWKMEWFSNDWKMECFSNDWKMKWFSNDWKTEWFPMIENRMFFQWLKNEMFFQRLKNGMFFQRLKMECFFNDFQVCFQSHFGIVFFGKKEKTSASYQFGKCVVPHDDCGRLGFLWPMHDDDHRQRQRLKRHRKVNEKNNKNTTEKLDYS